MSNSIEKTLASPLSGYWNGKPQPASPSNPAASSFQEVMKSMMLVSGMSSMTSTGSAAGSMPMNTFAPMMMMIMEQLMAQLDEAVDQPPDAQVRAHAAGFGQEFTGWPGAPVGSPVPVGLPVSGRISQGSRPGHTALDIAIPTGTPIRSTMAGKVVHAGWNHEGYGNLVIVENGPYRTYYAHLSEMPVTVGQEVSAGEVIALSGNTGNSTGPHLHYEVRVNHKQVNPAQSVASA